MNLQNCLGFYAFFQYPIHILTKFRFILFFYVMAQFVMFLFDSLITATFVFVKSIFIAFIIPLMSKVIHATSCFAPNILVRICLLMELSI